MRALEFRLEPSRSSTHPASATSCAGNVRQAAFSAPVVQGRVIYVCTKQGSLRSCILLIFRFSRPKPAGGATQNVWLPPCFSCKPHPHGGLAPFCLRSRGSMRPWRISCKAQCCRRIWSARPSPGALEFQAMCHSFGAFGVVCALFSPWCLGSRGWCRFDFWHALGDGKGYVFEPWSLESIKGVES